MQFFLVGLFGLAGVYARYGFNTLVQDALGSEVSLATLGINIIGSFLMGGLYALAIKTSLIPSEIRVALMSGLLGGSRYRKPFKKTTVSAMHWCKKRSSLTLTDQVVFKDFGVSKPLPAFQKTVVEFTGCHLRDPQPNYWLDRLRR